MNGEKLFRGFKPYITSPFGYRDAIYSNRKLIAPAGNHNGVDYGTNGKNIPVYIIKGETGVVRSYGVDVTGAKFVYIDYPRLGYTALYYHLNSYNVVKGATLDDTVSIGVTGKTGNATGVHLHFGWFKTSTFNNKKWEDFEKYQFPPKEVPKPQPEVNTIFHTVQSGEYLSKIASKYDAVWQDIAKINNIKGPDYIIYPGQVLKIPVQTVAQELKVGDNVVFTKDWNIYVSSTSDVPVKALYNGGTITKIIKGAKNPYLLNKTRGYVRKEDIIKI
jgi:murein DD-endopeptidase MepM/ murein hydrolase activator NlpD